MLKNLHFCHDQDMTTYSQRLKSLVLTVRLGQTTKAKVVQEDSVTETQENNSQSQSHAEEDNEGYQAYGATRHTLR